MEEDVVEQLKKSWKLQSLFVKRRSARIKTVCCSGKRRAEGNSSIGEIKEKMMDKYNVIHV